MRGFGLCVFLTAALLSPAAAAGQQPSPAQPDITVTGPRDIEEQIQDFVSALTPARISGQLGRFEWAACPAALGFSPAHKAAIESRLRAVAQAAGMRLGRPGCRANMLVLVTADKRVFFETLRRRHPRLLGGMASAAYLRLLNEPGPVSAWHQEDDLDADGLVLDGDMDAGVPINRSVGNAFRLTTPTRRNIEAAALVVEGRALHGLSIIQVADYAAMRLFARTDPSRLTAASPSTILRAIDAPMGSEVPLTLTEWDLAFLRGLYSSNPNQRAGGQRGEINGLIARQLEQRDNQHR
jgi:hypothetical protein